MSRGPDPASQEQVGHGNEDDFGLRMSIGDHLEELRTRLILSLLGIGAGAGLALLFGREILVIILRPLLVVQYENGMAPGLQVLSPTSAFSAYLRISILTGLILAMPWVLYQLWQFISAGLYRHERRFVKLLMPASVGLFVVGVAFLYFIVLPMLLQFFIQFNRGFDLPDLHSGPLARLLFDTEQEAPPGEAEAAPVVVPILRDDPQNPQSGSIWFNGTTRRLMVQAPSGLLSTEPLLPPRLTSIHSQFALDEYIAFVLTLALAFGLTFETPIVVFFLSWSGLVRRQTLASARRYVLLGIVVLAAILTPPDVMSQMMLAVPMYALFEIGLWAARWNEYRQAKQQSS
ncbi:MAG: twin-arginine translocase subunit TatC [Phycisphaerae bacterium]|nr:twin-arginine translocase subunit TatC [Phycisphaerae bacterium]